MDLYCTCNNWEYISEEISPNEKAKKILHTQLLLTIICSLPLMLLFLVIVEVSSSSYNIAAHAHIYSNATQVWIDKLNNLKIQFSHLPEKPSMDDLLQLEFSIQNLQNGSHLKNLIAKVTVTNNPTYKFDNITIADGDFSIRCPFLDPGIHQVIIKVGSKGYSLALASFNVNISNSTIPVLQ
jgi:hypothetical protein